MKLALIVLSLMLAISPAMHAQNIFDDEALETPKPTPEAKPAKKTGKTDAEEKAAAKPAKKKKKGGKKKKRAAAKEATAGDSSYTPENIARSSYAWAPESEPLTLTTTAPGIKGYATKEAVKATPVAMKPETVEEKPPAQGGGGFKLPQIPLAQVLIVAGFVILFLIYRFRVGRQIKRKRY